MSEFFNDKIICHSRCQKNDEQLLQNDYMFLFQLRLSAMSKSINFERLVLFCSLASKVTQTGVQNRGGMGGRINLGRISA